LQKSPRIKQKGDVDEYTHEWEALAMCIPELSEDQLLQDLCVWLKTLHKRGITNA
jgi:hypothetical protein